MNVEQNHADDQSLAIIIDDSFDYIEFSVIKHDGVYDVIYTYLKTNDDELTVDRAAICYTKYQAPTLEECAAMIKPIFDLNFFKLPIASEGTIYDENFQKISDIDWLLLLDVYKNNPTIFPENYSTIH